MILDQSITLFRCRCGESKPEELRARVTNAGTDYIAYLFCRSCGNLEQLFIFRSALPPLRSPNYPTFASQQLLKEEFDAATKKEEKPKPKGVCNYLGACILPAGHKGLHSWNE